MFVTKLVSGPFGDPDPEEAGGIGRVEEAGLSGDPGHQVGAGFKMNLAITAPIIRNDDDPGRSGFRVTGPLDGESGKGGVGGVEVGDANHGGAGDDRQSDLGGAVGIKTNHGATDGDVYEGVVADVEGGGDVLGLQRDGF